MSGGFSFGSTSFGSGISFTGGKTFYHGRMVLLDAIGSKLLSLTMPMQTQYYTTANNFVLNTADSCTSYIGGITNLTLSPSSGLSTTASLPATPVFNQGVLNITLSAPNTTGYVDVKASLSAAAANLQWLQYNWPYTGTLGTTFVDDPRARGTFGVYKGNDRIIYQKEIFQ